MCRSFFRSLAWLFCLTMLVAAGLSGCARQEAYGILDEANEHEALGREVQAIEAYHRAAEIAPDDAYLQRVLGRAFVRRRDYDRAAEALQAAIDLEAGYLEAYQDLIGVALRQDDTDAAIAWMERAAQSVPNYAPIYEQLVAFYMVNRQFEDALDLLGRLDETFPGAAWVPFHRGGVLRQLGQTEEALAAYNLARKLKPDLPDLWAEIGNLHFDLAAYGEAEDAFERAIEQDPGDHRSMNNLAWTYAVRGRNLEIGVELSRASLRLREEASYMDTLAELYYKQGDRKRALTWIRRAIRITSDSEDLMDHLQSQLERFRRAPYGRT